ncbi:MULTISPECIES: hypothetical protein [Peribacillus]|uniref:hypothetical protein n=1 Tax=Peribacillus TaxID=2675229 RepID=UPI0007BF9708|nr:hypothetical protein [Peribacillus sp. R9-11]WMX58088.1 hypothetical protein RE409_13190 [Peribacillus sp. R9-11]
MSVNLTSNPWKAAVEEPEEWLRWRLVMAEDCNVSYTEAFAMSKTELGIANAALDKMMKLRDDAMKKNSKKKK